MKKALSRKALEKEAGFWSGIKKKIMQNPVKVCRK